MQRGYATAILLTTQAGWLPGPVEKQYGKPSGFHLTLFWPFIELVLNSPFRR